MPAIIYYVPKANRPGSVDNSDSRAQVNDWFRDTTSGVLGNPEKWEVAVEYVTITNPAEMDFTRVGFYANGMPKYAANEVKAYKWVGGAAGLTPAAQDGLPGPAAPPPTTTSKDPATITL